MKPTKEKPRIIYDENYYKIQAVLENPNFGKRIKALKDKFAKFGCPIPPNGLRGYKDYMLLHDNLHKQYVKGKKSKKYKDAILKITGGKELLTIEQISKIDELDREMLAPIVYGYDLENILEEFGLDKSDKEITDWIEFFFLFNEKDCLKDTISIKFIPAEKDKEPELWVRYRGYTKPSDIKRKDIIDYQKLLPDYSGKNKISDLNKIRRNNIVIKEYKELRENNPQLRERREKGQSAADIIVEKYKKKYPELNRDLVEQIVKNRHTQ